MITYSTLISHVRPFFLSRWWDELADNDRMMFYANCALQDIFNIDSATFTYKTEVLTYADNSWTNKFTTLNSIRKVQQCIWTLDSWSTVELVPTLYIPDENDNTYLKFETWSKTIITHTDVVSINVVYVSEYEWATYPESLTEEIQVPARYVPAVCKLMYDWAAPVNLMSWETAQVDFFSHAMTRMKQLADDDSQTDSYKINPNY